MLADAIIPAGGLLDENFSRVANTSSKALIRFGTKTVLASTIEALRGSGYVRRISVVGSNAVMESTDAQLADEIVSEGKSGPENIIRGLRALLEHKEPPERIVICTCDLPFLSPEIIRSFLDACPKNRDFCVPLVSEAQFEEQYPGAHVTAVGLRDGKYTTGCLYLTHPVALKNALSHIEQVFANRKSKLGMARLLGWGFVLKLLTKQLTVPMVERKVESILKCTVAAIPNSAPELAYDIDYLEDYEYVVQSKLNPVQAVVAAPDSTTKTPN